MALIIEIMALVILRLRNRCKTSYYGNPNIENVILSKIVILQDKSRVEQSTANRVAGSVRKVSTPTANENDFKKICFVVKCRLSNKATESINYYLKKLLLLSLCLRKPKKNKFTCFR